MKMNANSPIEIVQRETCIEGTVICLLLLCNSHFDSQCSKLPFNVFLYIQKLR